MNFAHRFAREDIMKYLQNDDGMTTAEYAVGTVAAASLGGLLLKLLTSNEVRDLIWHLVSSAFGSLF